MNYPSDKKNIENQNQNNNLNEAPKPEAPKPEEKAKKEKPAWMQKFMPAFLDALKTAGAVALETVVMAVTFTATTRLVDKHLQRRSFRNMSTPTAKIPEVPAPRAIETIPDPTPIVTDIPETPTIDMNN